MSKSAKVRELLARGLSTAEIQQQVGCSTNLIYVLRSNANRGGRKKAPGKRRGPGRPPKAKVATRGSGLGQDLLASVRQVDLERQQLRAVLERMQTLVTAALDA